MKQKRAPFPGIDASEFPVWSPDRYFDTATGALTLIGLSRDETMEFVALGTPTMKTEHIIRDMQPEIRSGVQRTRWHHLYQKHESARQTCLRERTASVW